MIRKYAHLPVAAHDDQLRSQVDHYFKKQLSKKPTPRERDEAAAKTYRQFPILIDLYLRIKENEGDRAEAVSAERVAETDALFVEQLKKLVAEIYEKTDFFKKPISTYEEALLRAKHFKHYIEHQDGYRLINRNGQPFSTESEVQLFFGLAWFGTDFDVNREPNNGRGPVDFKISNGAADKSLVEFKLGSNSQLKRNLQNQVPIYEAANQTKKSLKVIVCYTQEQQDKVSKILTDLNLANHCLLYTSDAADE